MVFGRQIVHNLGWGLWGFWEIISQSSDPKIVKIVGGFRYMRSNFALFSSTLQFQIWECARRERGEKSPEKPQVRHHRHQGQKIMSSSGSWASGCPEKYPWIGGEERIPPWYEQERDLWVERSSSNVPSGDENRAPLEEIPQAIPPDPKDPRIQQLEDIAMDLTTRAFVAEATAQRTAEELERANELNNQLIDQLATLSNQSVQVWGELLGARSQLETQKWMFIAMTAVALAALARN